LLDLRSLDSNFNCTTREIGEIDTEKNFGLRISDLRFQDVSEFRTDADHHQDTKTQIGEIIQQSKFVTSCLGALVVNLLAPNFARHPPATAGGTDYSHAAVTIQDTKSN
jgi:hypothetical protein